MLVGFSEFLLPFSSNSSSPEGHFSESDPICRVSSSAEQLAFLIHSVGEDTRISPVCSPILGCN